MITVEEAVSKAYADGKLERLALRKLDINEVVKKISRNGAKIHPADVHRFLRAKGYDSGWYGYLIDVHAKKNYPKNNSQASAPESSSNSTGPRYSCRFDNVQRGRRSRYRGHTEGRI